MSTLADPAEVYPRWVFVDAPDVDANVRFDFHDRSNPQCATWPLTGGWSLGAPSVEGDLDAVNVEYGSRRLTATLVVRGLKAHALAKQARLAKELLRHRNWVAFKLARHTPWVWFRTWRADPGEMSFDQVYDDDLREDVWHIGISLPAEAFAYGKRVTHQAVAVSNGPSGNPLRYVLPTIKGDAPTKLRVRMATASTADAGRPSDWLLGVVSGSDQASCLGYVMDLGTGDAIDKHASVGDPVTSAALWGGSGRPVSFSVTPGLITRFGTVWAGIKRGRYRLRIRVTNDDATPATYLFAGGQSVAGVEVYNDPVAWSANLDSETDAAQTAWVDLGDLTFPPGFDAPDDVVLADYQVPLYVQIGRTSGTATLRIDALLLTPLDGVHLDSVSMMGAHFDGEGLALARATTWDGDTETAWMVFVSGGVDGYLGTKPSMTGGFPVAEPASAVNVLWAFPTDSGDPPAGAAALVTDVAVSHDITVSYHPRLLYLGDGT
jgi:hypothetical protein